MKRKASDSAIRPRILFVDAYDSFSNNIIALLEIELGVQVTKVHIDAQIPNLSIFLKNFVAVVAGPGPGHPANPPDVGLMRDLWCLPDADIIPVLGICLGFQSLVTAFGGTVSPLAQPRHGITTRFEAKPEGLFDELERVSSVQYHSLYASLGHEIPYLTVNENIPVQLWRVPSQLWQCHESTPLLQPLAWDLSPASYDTGGKENPSCILMAVKHTQKPFYGIQFHPESINSPPSSTTVVQNWWALVYDWYRESSKDSLYCSGRLSKKLPKETSSRLILNCSGIPPNHHKSSFSSSISPSSPTKSVSSYTTIPNESDVFDHEKLWLEKDFIEVGNMTLPDIYDVLGKTKGEIIVLDSEMHDDLHLSRYSIIGLVYPDTLKINYTTKSQHVELQWQGESYAVQLRGRTVFQYLKDFMERHEIINFHEWERGSLTRTPFAGGLMGYISYEACLESINVDPSPGLPHRPDICFAYIERSVILDHQEKHAHVQTIKFNDQSWIEETVKKIEDWKRANETGSMQGSYGNATHHETRGSYHEEASVTKICTPTEGSYKAKIRDCQREIGTGNSYELCLTDQTVIGTPSTPESISWPLYLRLRKLNPAPFSAFLRLGPLTLMSTSPERFMSWESLVKWRNPLEERKRKPILTTTCQFRPIKGTVKKNQVDANGKLVTLTIGEAQRILSTDKEQAENLMIVDLIRHDLHGVVGSGNVTVPVLMKVEEYKTVFQLVSVIEGVIETPLVVNDDAILVTIGDPRQYKEGIDVLAASLPPGSMTGAPKRRSCELLRDIENQQPRSVYSGVLGYMCVTGGGDFSVVIRTVFKWDDDTKDGIDEWRIGAGGAVTGLSTEEGEWEEMITKMKCTLGLFTEVDS
ncbi:para-aminobenzoate synthase, (PABA) [Ptychographa xylographoides]|nr:para-aminobenzoate synthase, (PABA) [Ptychographa xylographoides]